MGELFTDQLVQQLKTVSFSLNIDGSTNTNNEKYVSVWVSYFCTEKNEIAVSHLESFKVVKADSESIFKTIKKLFLQLFLQYDIS